MSGPLAIAATTAVLRELLQTGMTELGLADALGGEVTVSVLPPDRVVRDPPAAVPQLNLYLYGTARNAAWSNRDHTARDARGERVANPALALDLSYLITAYGVADYEAEVLLGGAMLVLHDTPGLGRDAIAAALAPAPNRPALLALLQEAGLAQQFESLKITPVALPSEEISRLWSAFDTPYRPSACYQMSALLMDSGRPARRALPVRERVIRALPMATLRVDRVVSTAGERQPISAGSTLRIVGRGLGGNDLRVLVSSPAAPDGVDISAGIIARADDEIRCTLLQPALPPALRAGGCALQVLRPIALGMPPLPHEGFSSNVAGFVLAPEVVPVAGAGAVTVACTPALGARQRVRLLLNQSDAAAGAVPRAYSFDAPAGNGVVPPATSTTAVTVPVPGVVAGSYLVRLQVDGAESALLTDAGGRYIGPEVVL